MKILFLAGGSPATVFALAPLAQTARNAGHEVFMASSEEMLPYVAGAGLPAVPVTDVTPPEWMFTDRDGSKLALPHEPIEEMRFAGRGFARLGVHSLPRLTALVEAWRPDLVVAGMLSYAAGLICTRYGIPFVRHAWDPAAPTEMDFGANQVLRPELDELGLDALPEPDMWIDICPPSLRPPDSVPAQMMRWIPGNQQKRLEPWMYTRPEGKRRVAITAGSQAGGKVARGQYGGLLREMYENLKSVDAEIVVAAPESIAADLRDELLGVRIGWIPLDVLAPTCDVIVSHGGGVTSMTATNAGVPQLLVPTLMHTVAPSERWAEYGAALTIPRGEDTPERSAAAVRELLANPSYRVKSQELAREIHALPLPIEVLSLLEKLVAEGGRA